MTVRPGYLFDSRNDPWLMWVEQAAPPYSKVYGKNYKTKHKAKKFIKHSLYSIPEFNRKIIKKYRIISNPGCYPTSIQIPLIPLIKNKVISKKNIIIDSKSGYSGAGRGVHKMYKNKNGTCLQWIHVNI